MSTRSQSLFQTILARLSFGAVPVDGVYWFDPRNAQAQKPRQSTRIPEVDWSPVGVSTARHFMRTHRK
jgi:hypothetical protein